MRPSTRLRQGTAVALALLTLVLAALGLVLGGGTLGGVDGRDRPPQVGDAFQLLSLLATAVVGLTLATRRPTNPIGWLFSWLGLATALYIAAGGYAIHDVVVAPGSLLASSWAVWLRTCVDRSATSLVLVAFLLFPTGRLASRRWRPALALVPLVAVGFALRAFVVGPMSFLGLPSPLVIEWLPLHVANGWVGGVPLIAGSVVAFGQLVTRYRTAGGIEREQIKWLTIPLVALLTAMIATVVSIVSGVSPDEGANGTFISALYAIAVFLLPVCMGIAVLRYRLFDIDVLINRALVYGATTALIAVAFLAAIVVLQALLRPITGGSELAVAVSTLASIALAQPLRRRMQSVVDRRFYRARYDAARTLDEFSARLRDEVALDAVRDDLLDAVGKTVKPTHASLWLRSE